MISTNVGGGLSIQWNQANLADSYLLEYADNANFTNKVDIEKPKTSTVHLFDVNSGLVNCKEYFFRVKAKNSKGFSAYSVVKNAIFVKLASPATATAVGASTTEIKMQWQFPNDFCPNAPTRAWYISYNEKEDFTGVGKGLAIQVNNNTNFIISDLKPNTTYYIRLNITNTLVSSSATYAVTKLSAKTLTIAPPIPAVPANLKATAKSSSQIDLSWGNVANETGFELERSLDGTAFTKIKDLATDVLTYSNTGLTASTKYFYRIRAVNSAGKSAYSAIVNATTSAPTVSVPFVPTNLKATAKSSSQIDLSWGNVANETGFELERSLDGTAFTKIKDIATDVLTYANTGLTASTKYFYRIRAVNSAGKSAYSAIVDATTQAASSALVAPKNLKQDLTNITINQLSLIWENTATGLKSVEIWKKIVGSADWILIDSLTTTPFATTYQDRNVRTGFTYEYRLRNKNTKNQVSGYSNILQVAAPIVSAVEPTYTEIAVFPNPFLETIAVYSHQKNENLRITDLQGKQLFEKIKLDEKIELNLTFLPAGSYFLTVQSQSNKETFKIVKK